MVEWGKCGANVLAGEDQVSMVLTINLYLDSLSDYRKTLINANNVIRLTRSHLEVEIGSQTGVNIYNKQVERSPTF